MSSQVRIGIPDEVMPRIRTDQFLISRIPVRPHGKWSFGEMEAISRTDVVVEVERSVSPEGNEVT